MGWFGALSGDQAVWGTAERNGVQLMVEKINEEGGILGRQIEFFNYDDKGDQLEAVNVVKRLIKEDKVLVVIGTQQQRSQYRRCADRLKRRMCQSSRPMAPTRKSPSPLPIR